LDENSQVETKARWNLNFKIKKKLNYLYMGPPPTIGSHTYPNSIAFLALPCRQGYCVYNYLEGFWFPFRGFL
jgi:hypothetical protein